ncbi:hypothetical protein V8C26DRAFT_432710 [Trichoderma gracile]
MSPIRIGLIGLGSKSTGPGQGKWRLSAHLASIHPSSHYKIMTVCNSLVDSVRRFIEYHKLPSTTNAYGHACSSDQEASLRGMAPPSQHGRNRRVEFDITFAHFPSGFVRFLGDFAVVKPTFAAEKPTVTLIGSRTREAVDPERQGTSPDHIFVQDTSKSGAVVSIATRTPSRLIANTVCDGSSRAQKERLSSP